MQFERIDLNNNFSISNSTQNKTSKFRLPKLKLPKLKIPKIGLKGKRGKILAAIFGVLSLVAILLVIFLVLPLKGIYIQALRAQSQAHATLAAAKNQDLKLAKEELSEMKDELGQLDKSADKIGWVGSLPAVGHFQKDFKHGISAGIAGVEAGQLAIEAIEPHADLLGLKGGSKFVEKSTEERLQTALTTLDKLTPKLGDIAEKLEVVQNEIGAIDANKYPKKFKGRKIREKIIAVQNQLDKTVGLFVESRPFLEAFPDLVGANEPKTYLVLFQNDKELRATGGFITAYAYFKMDAGKISVLKSDDIYNLDNARSKKVGAPAEILKYHKGVHYLTLRDSNLSPDFKVSMKQFEELYDDIRGRQEIDGIIAVDTNVLVEAMKILGPIPAYGTTFTTEPDKRCGGCPQVVYALEEYADRRVGHVRGNRKDIIGVLLLSIMQKSLGVSPGQYWGRLFQMALDEIQQKHILAFFHDKDAQKGAEALNFAGRIKKFDGDYLHINDTNFAGAKSNMYTNHTVVQDIEVGNDGTVTKTLTITYKNTQAASPGCNLERGGLCLNGLLRNWLRIYVPKGAKLQDFKGSKTEPVVKEELGKTVFEGFVEVRPKGQAVVKVSYKLADKIDGEFYKMLIQKQPGTEGHSYIINLNGSEIEKFNLVTDKEVEIKL
jgi:hypothetical protein